MMEIAILENIQRENLSPIEEAQAYARLINEYNMTQEKYLGTLDNMEKEMWNQVESLCAEVSDADKFMEFLCFAVHIDILLYFSLEIVYIKSDHISIAK